MNVKLDAPVELHLAVERAEGQCQESFDEQKRVFDFAMNKCHSFKGCNKWSIKGLIVNGGPGTGKTTLMELVIISALAMGLNCLVTAVMAERASQLGGIHLSQLMMIPVRKGVPPGRLAEMAYLELMKAPDKLALLRRMDVLFIDEVGQVSCELLATLDMILRRVRLSTQFMGGILLFGTYDHKQLPPVNGKPSLLSPFMLTSLSLMKLEHSVRAGKDEKLRQIQALTRLSPKEFLEQRETFLNLIENHCRFVQSFDDPGIPPTTLRMFGKKKAAANAVSTMLQRMQQKYQGTGKMKCFNAIDLEATMEGVFVEASPPTSRRLCTEVKEPECLWLYPDAVYEVTQNLKHEHNQGQLAVLCEVPNDQDLADKKPLHVMLAPPGVKSLPLNFVSVDQLGSLGWKKSRVGICPDRIHNFTNGIQAKRLQYGLRPRIACTIHSGMGQDLPSILTRVTSPDEDMDYVLWAKEQVIVLLSRTHRAQDIIFVGDPQKTAKALADCLSHVSQYADYMDHIMKKLCGIAHTLVDPYRFNPFRMCDYQIPNYMASFCYHLVSLGDPTHTTSYIGETHNLAHRYAQHNQRNGARTTKDVSLIPWALLGYVCGFEGDVKIGRKQFEKDWEQKRSYWQWRLKRPITPTEIGVLAIKLIQRHKTTEKYGTGKLLYVRCGNIAS